MAKKWVVCFCINEERTHALLIDKKGGPFPGKLNGLGGHIEKDERPLQAVIRELWEEGEIAPTKLVFLHKNTFPNGDELYIFYAVVPCFDPSYGYSTAEGMVGWYSIHGDRLLDVRNERLAGTGNVPYSIHQAVVEEGGLPDLV